MAETLFNDPSAPQPSKPDGVVPPDMAAEMEGAGGPTISPMYRGDQRIEPVTATAETVVAQAAVSSPDLADKAADAVMKLRGQTPPAGVSTQHILIISMAVLAAFIVFSFKVMFSTVAQFDDSMKAAVIQVWMTLGTAVVVFYVGSSAGSKNLTAERQASQATAQPLLTYQPPTEMSEMQAPPPRPETWQAPARPQR